MKKNNTVGQFPQLFKVSVIIPAFNPPKTIIQFINELKTGGIQKIVVVNDGSSKEHKELFNKISEQGATVLNHPINRGVGAAIKTGIAYVEQNHLSSIGVITVDCDGQHSSSDTIMMAGLLKENPTAAILGIRKISPFKMPVRNFVGNIFASFLFLILRRRYITDTQCGLRAFPASIIPDLLALNGQQFEYITQTLVYLLRSSIDVIKVPVQTIYSKQIGTHFRSIHSSWAILRAMFE